MTTIAFHKPYGVVSHFTDSDGAPTLAEYISMRDVYAAGRLDKDSEGLLLLTDDGRLAARITGPKAKIPKTYLAQVERVPEQAALMALRLGVTVQGYHTRPAIVELMDSEPDLPPRSIPIRFRKNVPTAWLKLTIHEGKKRQIRHMTAAVGHPTLRLVRIAIGPVILGDLKPGEWRELSKAELQALRDFR